MKANKLFLISAIGGLLAWIGFEKYKDVSQLKNVTFKPGAMPFQFSGIKDGIASFIVSLAINNPAPVKVNIDSLSVEAWYKNIYLGDVKPTKVVINAQTTTNQTLPMNLNASKLLNFTKDFLTRGSIPVLFKVSASIVVAGGKFTIPYNITLDVKDALREYAKQTQPMLAQLL